MTSTAILIPARYYSSRFPGKPLCRLGQQTMIERVYNTCSESGIDTYVLTDDRRIADLIPDRHSWIDEKDTYLNGTERCAAAVQQNPLLTSYDQFINVQGDMPDVTVEMIKRIETNIQMSDVVTAWTEMDLALQSDPNSVKVVHNNVFAHWFGRGITCGSHHLGIYGYTRKALAAYRTTPSDYESHEGLEQLRWFYLNYKVGVTRVDFDGMEINTPQDMERWNATI